MQEVPADEREKMVRTKRIVYPNGDTVILVKIQDLRRTRDDFNLEDTLRAEGIDTKRPFESKELDDDFASVFWQVNEALCCWRLKTLLENRDIMNERGDPFSR